MGTSNFAGSFDKTPDYFDGEAKLSRSHGSAEQPDLYKLMKELAYTTAKWQKDAADGAAGTATAERAFHQLDTYKKSLQKVVFTPGAALTADNTNYATLIVRARKAATSRIVAQVTTQITGSGSWVAHTPVTIPLHDGTNALAVDNATLNIAADEHLTVEITKAGTGVVVPVGALSAFLK